MSVNIVYKLTLPLTLNVIIVVLDTECAKQEDGENGQGPCPDTCWFRQVTFQGEETVQKFCEYFKVIAHNLLEYLSDNSMCPDKIMYNGSKIMYMTVERGLHMQILDILTFLPMKLAALPKAFGLTELKKGWFLHYFNRKENQHYVENSTIL